jgi:hypothetical protein
MFSSSNTCSATGLNSIFAISWIPGKARRMAVFCTTRLFEFCRNRLSICCRNRLSIFCRNQLSTIYRNQVSVSCRNELSICCRNQLSVSCRNHLTVVCRNQLSVFYSKRLSIFQRRCCRSQRLLGKSSRFHPAICHFLYQAFSFDHQRSEQGETVSFPD